MEKPLPASPARRALERGVEGEQVRAVGDLVDHLDHRADALDPLGQLGDGVRHRDAVAADLLHGLDELADGAAARRAPRPSVSSATRATAPAFSAICAEACLSSSIVAVVSWIAAACSVEDVSCWVDAASTSFADEDSRSAASLISRTKVRSVSITLPKPSSRGPSCGSSVLRVPARQVSLAHQRDERLERLVDLLGGDLLAPLALLDCVARASIALSTPASSASRRRGPRAPRASRGPRPAPPSARPGWAKSASPFVAAVFGRLGGGGGLLWTGVGGHLTTLLPGRLRTSAANRRAGRDEPRRARNQGRRAGEPAAAGTRRRSATGTDWTPRTTSMQTSSSSPGLVEEDQRAVALAWASPAHR